MKNYTKILPIKEKKYSRIQKFFKKSHSTLGRVTFW